MPIAAYCLFAPVAATQSVVGLYAKTLGGRQVFLADHSQPFVCLNINKQELKIMSMLIACMLLLAGAGLSDAAKYVLLTDAVYWVVSFADRMAIYEH
jgi:hypothetical protein